MYFIEKVTENANKVIVYDVTSMQYAFVPE